MAFLIIILIINGTILLYFNRDRIWIPEELCEIHIIANYNKDFDVFIEDGYWIVEIKIDGTTILEDRIRSDSWNRNTTSLSLPFGEHFINVSYFNSNFYEMIYKEFSIDLQRDEIFILLDFYSGSINHHISKDPFLP